MIKNKSTLDVAYDYLKEEGSARTFLNIWRNVVKVLEIENPNERVASFYTNLTLDGRFVALPATRKIEGKDDINEWLWNLTERVKVADRKVKIEDEESAEAFTSSDSDFDEENENVENEFEVVEEDY